MDDEENPEVVELSGGDSMDSSWDGSEGDGSEGDGCEGDGCEGDGPKGDGPKGDGPKPAKHKGTVGSSGKFGQSARVPRGTHDWVMNLYTEKESHPGRWVCTLCLQQDVPKPGHYRQSSSRSPLLKHMEVAHKIFGKTWEKDLENFRKRVKGKGVQLTGFMQQRDIMKGMVDPYPARGTKWERCAMLTAQFLASACLPSQLASDTCFVSFMRCFDKQFPTLSRRSIMRRAEQLSDGTQRQLRGIFEAHGLGNGTEYALTTDIWTSAAQQSYLTLTVHYIVPDWKLHTIVLGTMHFPSPHDGARVAHYIRRMRLRFGLVPPKVMSRLRDYQMGCWDDFMRRVCEDDDEWKADFDSAWNAAGVPNVSCTTDCGANLISAVHFAKMDWMKCMCHVLNTAVKTALREKDEDGTSFTDGIDKIRGLANYLKKSPKTMETFLNLQAEAQAADALEESSSDDEDFHVSEDRATKLRVRPKPRRDGQPLKLIRPADTRWSTWYASLLRACDVKGHVEKLLSEGHRDRDGRRLAELFPIRPSDWCMYEELLPVLAHIYSAQLEFQHDKRVTASSVLPTILDMLYVAPSPATDSKPHTLLQGEAAKTFFARFKKKLLVDVDDGELVYAWAFATALDGAMIGPSYVEWSAETIWKNAADWPKVTATPEYAFAYEPEDTSAAGFVDYIWSEITAAVSMNTNFPCVIVLCCSSPLMWPCTLRVL